MFARARLKKEQLQQAFAAKARGRGGREGEGGISKTSMQPFVDGGVLLRKFGADCGCYPCGRRFFVSGLSASLALRCGVGHMFASQAASAASQVRAEKQRAR